MALIVTFQNDGSGTDEAANYNVDVYVNQRLIAKRRVEGHNRSEAWDVLVGKLVTAVNAEAAKPNCICPVIYSQGFPIPIADGDCPRCFPKRKEAPDAE